MRIGSQQKGDLIKMTIKTNTGYFFYISLRFMCFFLPLTHKSNAHLIAKLELWMLMSEVFLNHPQNYQHSFNLPNIFCKELMAIVSLSVFVLLLLKGILFWLLYSDLWISFHISAHEFVLILLKNCRKFASLQHNLFSHHAPKRYFFSNV